MRQELMVREIEEVVRGTELHSGRTPRCFGPHPPILSQLLAGSELNCSGFSNSQTGIGIGTVSTKEVHDHPRTWQWT
jgi:hypothetical protein